MSAAPRHPTLEESAALAAELHAGQTDKAGAPYIGHLARVHANLVRLFPDASEAERHAAWLHDSIEDTLATVEALRARGYSDEVIAIVEAVTKPDVPVPYQDWIDDLVAAGALSALRVKLADLSDNFNPERLGVLPRETVAKLEGKYRPAIEAVRQGLGMAAP